MDETRKKMQNITINLPEAYCDGIERLLKYNVFVSRSQAIRVALAEFLEKEFSVVELLGLKESDGDDDPKGK
ncbi:MAG: ribbon-helix-helix domain-containing protein [Promethearchaeota archaeon]